MLESQPFGFEVVEVLVGEGIGLEGEVLVGAEVVDPEVFGPRGFAGGFEKEQISNLFNVIAVAAPRVLEDVGVVPDFGDDGGRVVVGHEG